MSEPLTIPGEREDYIRQLFSTKDLNSGGRLLLVELDATRDALQKAEEALSDQKAATLTQHGIQRAVQRQLATTQEVARELLAALEAVSKLEGCCLMGNPAQGEDMCQAYRTGSSAAFDQAASIAKTKLKRATALLGDPPASAISVNEDSDRLDWVLRYRHDVNWWQSPNGERHVILDGTNRFIGRDWREAIDAARKQEPASAGESTGNAPLALRGAMVLLEDAHALIDYMAESLKVKTRPPTFDRITKALASYHAASVGLGDPPAKVKEHRLPYIQCPDCGKAWDNNRRICFDEPARRVHGRGRRVDG
jgi:hypothetical protein